MCDFFNFYTAPEEQNYEFERELGSGQGDIMTRTPNSK